jgi:hypothetical protein
MDQNRIVASRPEGMKNILQGHASLVEENLDRGRPRNSTVFPLVTKLSTIVVAQGLSYRLDLRVMPVFVDLIPRRGGYQIKGSEPKR